MEDLNGPFFKTILRHWMKSQKLIKTTFSKRPSNLCKCSSQINLNENHKDLSQANKPNKKLRHMRLTEMCLPKAEVCSLNLHQQSYQHSLPDIFLIFYHHSHPSDFYGVVNRRSPSYIFQMEQKVFESIHCSGGVAFPYFYLFLS